VIKLYSYPGLFGLPDNNPYGLKIFAFLKLCGLRFRHVHILDPKEAPRGQLPYIDDDGFLIGDSDAIASYLIEKYDLAIGRDLTPSQRDAAVMLTRTLDDLYWVMSYLRWKDDRYYPLFRDEFLKTHAPLVTQEALDAARDYNSKRYYFQGIGRYGPPEVCDRGLADLGVFANLMPQTGYFFGPRPSSIDAALYGFIANIYYYEIETPLRSWVAYQSNLVRHCDLMRAAVS
jgi:glutathione S-transferase